MSHKGNWLLRRGYFVWLAWRRCFLTLFPEENVPHPNRSLTRLPHPPHGDVLCFCSYHYARDLVAQKHLFLFCLKLLLVRIPAKLNLEYPLCFLIFFPFKAFGICSWCCTYQNWRSNDLSKSLPFPSILWFCEFSISFSSFSCHVGSVRSPVSLLGGQALPKPAALDNSARYSQKPLATRLAEPLCCFHEWMEDSVNTTE